MSSEKNIQNVADTTATAGAENPPALVKKIGRTTYIVRIHFSKTSTETMSDKIKRMLKNDIVNIPLHFFFTKSLSGFLQRLIILLPFEHWRQTAIG